MSYLEEAAALLRDARDHNEERAGTAGQVRGEVSAEKALCEVNDRRMEIAAGFTRLAAIERGLNPWQPPAQDEEPPASRFGS